jgi:hypothetical protein
METRYEICDDDGVFRMPRAEIGKMLAEILMVDFIHHIEATAMGPLIIVRRSIKDNDPEDPVLSILARYGIASDFDQTLSARHHQCRSPASKSKTSEPLCRRQGSRISADEGSRAAVVP